MITRLNISIITVIVLVIVLYSVDLTFDYL